jgi:hypothetical protein
MNTGSMTKRYRRIDTAYKVAAPRRTGASILVSIYNEDVEESEKEIWDRNSS